MKFTWFLFVFVLFGFTVQCNEVPSLSPTSKKMCDLNDSKCVTNAANKYVFQVLVPGIKGLLEPLDPFHIDEVSGHFEDFDYKKTNVTMTGQKGCTVEEVQFVGERLEYEYYLRCPELVTDFKLEAKGKLEDIEIDGVLFATETIDDYLIIIKGWCDEYVSEKDNKTHIKLTEYVIENVLDGTFKFEISNFITGDKEKFDQFTKSLNGKYGKSLVKIDQNPVLVSFMKELMTRFNKFFETFSFEELFVED